MISNFAALKYLEASRFHYSLSSWKSASWGNKKIADLVRNGKGTSFYSADSTQSSCAIRLSIALYLGGAKFIPIKNSWWFDDPRVEPKDQKRKSWQDALLPSEAKDYHDMLPGGVDILGDTEERQRKALAGKQGIVFFATSGRASGHVTFWNKVATSCATQEKDEYFGGKVRFWSING